ncbi:amino acid ABC transporter substrate-binding protein [Anaerotardibacter muris]|uniref:amino acid ABC transporter substrate-binding protein n=1 Tax=Anaerotardibacter muris TaxID=2941505 RepID=UPI0020410B76|nr:amino acid ABC transporter substrate-binding protein [Anaerotardibacter muris]
MSKALNMKKLFLAVFAAACMVCLSAVLMTGCSSNSNSSSSETPEYLGDDGKFVIGFDETFKPFGYKDDNGEYTGFDLELAQAVAEKNGWEIELMPIDWDTKDAQIDAGTIDVIWNGFTIEGREDAYEFTDPYYLNDQVILVREGSDINSLSDLAGKTVVAQVNSPAYDNLAEGGDYYDSLGSTLGALETAPEYQTALMQLESGACDAVAIDYPTAQSLISGKDGYVILDEVVSSENYGVGAKKGNTELIEQIQSALIELYNDGTIEEIASHYPEEISIDKWVLK